MKLKVSKEKMLESLQKVQAVVSTRFGVKRISCG